MNLRFRHLIVAAGLLFGLAAISTAGPVRIALRTATVVGGSTFNFPVYVDSSLTGLGVTAYQLEFIYSSTVMTFLGIDTTGTLAGGWGTAVANETSPGHVFVAASGADTLAGTGQLVILRFKAGVFTYQNYASVNLISSVLNEGTPVTTNVNGSVTVNVPPSITVSPDTWSMTKGETKQFSVSGATGPITWSTTNSGVAAISNAGLLSALGAGFVKVVAVDSVGIIDTSGNVEVRALKLSVRDTSVYQGQFLNLPVATTDLSGLGIVSGEISLTYNQNLWTAVDVITSGTLTTAAGTPQFSVTSGKIAVSFAGSSVLSGSGTLLIVRLKATTSTYGGSSIGFQNVVFNQDILANTQTGTASVTSLPAITVSPGGTQSIVKGDSLQFSASGGTGPYVWSVSDSQKATISSSGLVTVRRGGSVVVSAKDFYGSSGSSGTVNLYDFRLTVPSWSQFVFTSSDTVVEIPVTVTANDTGFVAFQMKLTYGTGYNLVLDSIATAGTLVPSWSVVPSYSSGNVVLAAAGTSPITAAGTLLRLRFKVPSSTPRPSTTSVSFNNVLFNEGSPIPLITNGSLQIRSTNSKPVFSSKSPSSLDSLALGQAQLFSVSVYDPDSDPLTYSWSVNGTVEQSGPSNAFNRTFSSVSAGTTVKVVFADPFGLKDSASWAFKVVTITSVETGGPALPNGFALSQNYPNPFNPSTTIQFSIPQSAFVNLTIYDVLGNVVETLVSTTMPAGVHSFRWNAVSFANGTYFYRLQAGELIQTRKLVLLK